MTSNTKAVKRSQAKNLKNGIKRITISIPIRNEHQIRKYNAKLVTKLRNELLAGKGDRRRLETDCED